MPAQINTHLSVPTHHTAAQVENKNWLWKRQPSLNTENSLQWQYKQVLTNKHGVDF